MLFTQGGERSGLELWTRNMRFQLLLSFFVFQEIDYLFFPRFLLKFAFLYFHFHELLNTLILFHFAQEPTLYGLVINLLMIINNYLKHLFIPLNDLISFQLC